MQEPEQGTRERFTWAMSLSDKWHAYRGETSVCGLASIHAATRSGVPPTNGSRCYWCRKALGMPIRPSANATPMPLPMMSAHQRIEDQREVIDVEILGGALDGVHLLLHVVREGMGSLRVLENRYQPRKNTPQQALGA